MVVVTGIGDPILSLCIYFPLLSICITWLPSVLVSSSHMWQYIFFYLSNHHYVYSASGIASYHIPPWSIVSDLSLAGFLNTLLEVFSHRTALYTYHLPVSPSWGFPEKEQRLCNGFPKHQRSPLDTARISLFPSTYHSPTYSYWIPTKFPKRHFHIFFHFPQLDSYWTPTGFLLDSYWTPTELKQMSQTESNGSDTGFLLEYHYYWHDISYHFDQLTLSINI